MVKNCDDMLSRFHLILERYGRTDWQTDRRTDLLYQYRASVCWRAIKTGITNPYSWPCLTREEVLSGVMSSGGICSHATSGRVLFCTSSRTTVLLWVCPSVTTTIFRWCRPIANRSEPLVYIQFRERVCCCVTHCRYSCLLYCLAVTYAWLLLDFCSF